MRLRSSTTVPAIRGEAPPYPWFLPQETGHSGMPYWFATRRIACTSSEEAGATAAGAACAASSAAIEYGSAYEERASPVMTHSLPTIRRNAASAESKSDCERPGGSRVAIRSLS